MAGALQEPVLPEACRQHCLYYPEAVVAPVGISVPCARGDDNGRDSACSKLQLSLIFHRSQMQRQGKRAR